MRTCNNLPQPNPYILVFGGCGRLLHVLTPPRSAFLNLQCLARCPPYILLHFYTSYIYDCRKVPVEGSKVTAALWGPFDEYFVTGHENGAVCRYDVTRVRYIYM